MLKETKYLDEMVFIPSVQLLPTRRDDLLNWVDRTESTDSDNSKRSPAQSRSRYRACDIRLTVEHPGGGVGRFLACSRNLSSQGISFLHGGYLHCNTRCEFVLTSRDDQELTIQGVVNYSKHIEGALHVVDAAFDEPLDPKLFLDEEALMTLFTETFSPQEICGKVMHMCDQDVECHLFKHHLASTRVSLVTCASSGEAIDVLKKQPFDLVLYDIDGSLGKGETDVIRKMLEVGYRNPIVVLTAEPNGQRTASVRDAGACAVLAKPFDAAKLLAFISEHLESTSSDEPLYSELGDDADMRDLLTEFTTHVKQQLHDLQIAMAEKEFDTVRRLCLAFKGEGAAFGFPLISSAADEALSAIDASCSLEESLNTLHNLKRVCGRIRNGKSV